jgi:hypothetical protein
MLNKRKWLTIGILLGFIILYGSGLLRNIGEASRRSLEMKDTVQSAGQVAISIEVTGLDLVNRQLNARIRFRSADAETYPTKNLKLHLNALRGQREFDFPKGKSMSGIDVTFPVDGQVNQYPFDKYQSDISLIMLTPEPKAREVPQNEPQLSPDPGSVTIDEADLQSSIPVPLSVSVSASTPGIKYEGRVIRGNISDSTGQGQVTRILFSMRRPDNLIAVSIMVMFMMTGLAISTLAMALKAINSPEKFDVLPLSLSISLIFGLPALRNIQPNVPPVGVFGDYFSFL